MAKLTKTESRILADMHKRGYFTASRAYGHGAEGGRKSGGWREFNAACRLIERGLANQRGEIDRSTETRHGYTMHYVNIVIEPKKGENNER